LSFYLDTSVVVPLLIDEIHSQRVGDWLAGQADAALSVSLWTTAEISSALSMRIRAGTLSTATRDAALGLWSRLCRESFGIVEIDPAHFTRAAALVDRHTLGLRAPDALHLAIAEAAGATMVTLDERLKSACLAVGLPVAAV
jgi:uncharacterized protein